MKQDFSDLTEKQKKIYEYLVEFSARHPYPPTVREICSAVGLRSTSSVHSHLLTLQQLGYIRKYANKNRALEITGPLPDGQADAAPEFDGDTVAVPVVGTVAAGQPLLAVEQITDYFPLPAHMLPNQQTFMLTVKGDSMIQAGIYDGSLVLVAQQSTAQNGDMVVALVDDSATVKTFYKEDGHIRLQPENDAMEPIIVQDAEILGKVIGTFRMF